MTPVSLRDLVGEMTLLSDEVHGYLNRVTGEMITITDDEIRDVENEADFSQRLKWEQEVFEKNKEVLESDDYLELPSHYEIHECSIMEDFCAAYPNEGISEDLLDLIRGSSAFHRFKNYINWHGIEKEWYEFLDNAYKKIAIDWLEDNEIAYTDDMIGK